MGVLSAGQQVYLRDAPVEAGGETWWPVTIGNPADGLDGYVWANGLDAGHQTVRDRIDLGIDNAVEWLKEKVSV